MELDEMKAAWQAVNERLDRQHALQRALLRDHRLGGMRSSLRPLFWGQILQIVAGVVVLLWGARHWVDHVHSVPSVVCGVAVQAFGILMVAFAGRLLYLLGRVDHAGPVLAIQQRLARIRQWRVRVEGPVFAVLSSVIWLPMLLMLAEQDGDRVGADLWLQAPQLAGRSLVIAIGSAGVIVVAYWLLRTFGGGRWLQSSLAGRSVRRAEAVLEELARFERE